MMKTWKNPGGLVSDTHVPHEPKYLPLTFRPNPPPKPMGKIRVVELGLLQVWPMARTQSGADNYHGLAGNALGAAFGRDVDQGTADDFLLAGPARLVGDQYR